MPNDTSNRLNPTDATLWEIKRDPELRTTILAVAMLDAVPEWDLLAATVKRVVDGMPRLSQRVEDAAFGIGRPRWTDTEVDLPFHLRRLRSPHPGGVDAVLELCHPLAGEEFDVDRPLWQLYLVDGLGDGQAALILKVSHTLTDGVGGVALLESFADGATLVPQTALPEPDITKPDPIRSAIAAQRKLGAAALRASVHPVRTATGAATLAASSARLLAPARAPLSPLLTERGMGRWLGATEVPFERLKKAAHRAGGTVNDAFVTIALSALADYHIEFGSEAGPVRVTMPVSFRSDDDPDAGNQWTPARFVASIDPKAHPFDALQTLRLRLHSASHEPAISISQTLVAGLQELPSGLTTSIVAGMVKGSDVVLTDVPGPKEEIVIAGAKVQSVFPFAPVGGAALNFALMSYAGRACFGLTVDTTAVADPERMLELFDARVHDFLRRRTRPAKSASSTTTSAPDETPGSHRLSALDTSFLRMESDETPMHMGSLLLLDGLPLRDEAGMLRLDAIRARIDRRLDRVERLRQNVTEVPFELGRPVWVEDPDFDISNHVHLISLDEPGTRAQLIEVCERLQMAVLPRSQPLFELTLIDGLDPKEFGEGAVALVEKIHHAAFDGMSGVELLSTFFDTEPHLLEGTEAPQRSTPRPKPSSLKVASDAVVDQIDRTVGAIRSIGRLVRSPQEALTRASALSSATRGLLRPLVGHHSVRHEAHGDTRLLIPVSLPLTEVHDIGEALGGTVNDVVLTLVTAGFRALYEQRDVVAPHPFTAMVPVSTRVTGLAGEHGNHVSSIMVELPIAEPDPAQAVGLVAESVRRSKAQHEANGTELLLSAADLLSPIALDAFARAMEHQHVADVVVTNMPGPRSRLSFAGGTIGELIPIVPLGANIAAAVAVISYVDDLVLALHADAASCPDIGLVADGIQNAFAALSAL